MLAGVSLTVPKGETYVIMGGSGSGKTVMLRLIAGLDPARPRRQSGCSAAASSACPRRSCCRCAGGMGYVFQGAALFDSLSVYENVAYPLREHTEPRRGARSASASCTSCRWSASARRCSAAARRSCRAACASGSASPARSLGEPEMLLFDEPTAGLDPTNSRLVAELIAQLRDGVCDTAIVVTHDLELARTVADRVAILIEGRFAALGPARRPCSASDDPAVQAFLAGEARVRT